MRAGNEKFGYHKRQQRNQWSGGIYYNTGLNGKINQFWAIPHANNRGTSSIQNDKYEKPKKQRDLENAPTFYNVK